MIQAMKAWTPDGVVDTSDSDEDEVVSVANTPNRRTRAAPFFHEVVPGGRHRARAFDLAPPFAVPRRRFATFDQAAEAKAREDALAARLASSLRSASRSRCVMAPRSSSQRASAC